MRCIYLFAVLLLAPATGALAQEQPLPLEPGRLARVEYGLLAAHHMQTGQVELRDCQAIEGLLVALQEDALVEQRPAVGSPARTGPGPAQVSAIVFSHGVQRGFTTRNLPRPGCSPSGFSADRSALQFLSQGLAINAENLSGPRLVAVHACQDIAHVLGLDFGQRAVPADAAPDRVAHHCR